MSGPRESLTAISRTAVGLAAVSLVIALLATVLVAAAQEKSRPAAERGDAGGRGKYIVEQVAMCVECHTPRDDNGQLLRSKYLDGAPVPVKAPSYPNIQWAVKAPALAGLPGYTKEEGVRLLTEGITRDGRRPNPPMPQFRMTRADAEAVVGYLQSLQ
jgi:mono/diheme cytochrome c family protein